MRQDVGINAGYNYHNNDVRSQDTNTSSAGDHSHTFSGSFSVTSDSGTASGTTGDKTQQLIIQVEVSDHHITQCII